MLIGWWQAGELGILTKYENRRPSDIIVQLVLVAALWYVLPQKYWNIPAIFGVLSIPYVIAEQRIAIMFTNDQVVYRPAFRSPRRVKFEHINEITRVSVRRFVGGTFSGFYPGVQLRLIGGETVIWRLPESGATEALRHLQVMTKTVTN